MVSEIEGLCMLGGGRQAAWQETGWGQGARKGDGVGAHDACPTSKPRCLMRAAVVVVSGN